MLATRSKRILLTTAVEINLFISNKLYSLIVNMLHKFIIQLVSLYDDLLSACFSLSFPVQSGATQAAEVTGASKEHQNFASGYLSQIMIVFLHIGNRVLHS
jgi:hypothetical protein